MSDLISRQAALDAIDKNRDALLSSGMTGAEHILVHYGRRVIEELPPIEPKRGKWKIINGVLHPLEIDGVCSICDYATGNYNFYNYCPNCGAKMERSEDGEA